MGAALAALSAPAAADVLAPGTKAVRHELVVEPGPALEGLALVATPLHGFQPGGPVVPGEPFRFSTKYGTRLYALPAGAPVPSEPEAVRAAALASADLPLSEETAVPLWSPVARIVTTLRVTSVRLGEPEPDEPDENSDPGAIRDSGAGADRDRGRIVLEIAGEERLDAAGHPSSPAALLAVLATTAAAGALGVVLLARRRYRAGAAA